MVHLKRAYEPPDNADGHRVLVDRLWPRGVRKDEAHLDEWLKDVAPSDELRKWFGHDADRWDEFQERYRRELRAAGAAAALDSLLRRARAGAVTLVYSAHDEEHNNAVALKKVIDGRLSRARRSGG